VDGFINPKWMTKILHQNAAIVKKLRAAYLSFAANFRVIELRRQPLCTFFDIQLLNGFSSIGIYSGSSFVIGAYRCQRFVQDVEKTSTFLSNFKWRFSRLLT
jgi:hypothetical protein